MIQFAERIVFSCRKGLFDQFHTQIAHFCSHGAILGVRPGFIGVDNEPRRRGRITHSLDSFKVVRVAA